MKNEDREHTIAWLKNNRNNGAFEDYPEDTINFDELPDDELNWYFYNWVLEEES